MESLTLLPEYRPKRPPSHVFEQVAYWRSRRAGNIVEVFAIREERESIVF
jgi:hypothetical protein